MSPTEARSFHAQAIVLRHMEFGEADRIMTLFTLERGKIKAIAKGVRKIKSRKAGHLEPFTLVNLYLAQGRDLAIITQAETQNAFIKIKEDLTLTGYAAYMVELLERFTYEEGENRALFKLIIDSLMRLEQAQNPANAVHYYEVRLMDLLGYRPDLINCASCSKLIQPEDQYFSAQAGGALCPDCGRQAPNAWPVSMPALKYFRHFQRSKYAQVKDLQVPPEAEAELKLLIERYLTFLLEHKLNTPQFMRDVARTD